MPLSAQERIILIRVKLERAKTHLKDFETQANTFRDVYTHVVSTNSDPNALQAIHNFHKLPISRFDVLAAAGDVLQNLRSALDHLAYSLVEVGLNRRLGKKRGSRISFPIFDTAKQYETTKAGKIKGARKSAIKAIDALKPYKRGNPVLWYIHHLNIIDKHRHIITVGSDYLFEGEGFNGHYWHKAARPLFRGIFGPEVHNNTKVVVKKPRGKSKVIEGQPLFEFVHDAVDFVDTIIGTFEPHLRPRRRRSRFP